MTDSLPIFLSVKKMREKQRQTVVNSHVININITII